MITAFLMDCLIKNMNNTPDPNTFKVINQNQTQNKDTIIYQPKPLKGVKWIIGDNDFKLK